MSTIQKGIAELEKELSALDKIQTEAWNRRQALNDRGESFPGALAAAQIIERGKSLDEGYDVYLRAMEDLQKCKYYKAVDAEIDRRKTSIHERLKHLRATCHRLTDDRDRLTEEITRRVQFFEDHVVPRSKQVGAKKTVVEFRGYRDPNFQAVTEIRNLNNELASVIERIGGDADATRALKAGRWTEERIGQMLAEARG